MTKVTKKHLQSKLDEFLLSNNFDINRPVIITSTKLIDYYGYYSCDYYVDDNDDIDDFDYDESKMFHTIVLGKRHVEEDGDEWVGTLIHELIHAEQAEHGLITDHDDYFFDRVYQLRCEYPMYEIANVEMDT